MKSWSLMQKAKFKPQHSLRKEEANLLKRYERKHCKCMKSKPNEYYAEMSREEVTKLLNKLNEFSQYDGLTKMKKKLQRISTTRHLQIRHDHSTLANTGHIIFTEKAPCLHCSEV